MTQKKYPVCLVCHKPYTERQGLRFRHFDQDQAGVYWHSAKPVFPVKTGDVAWLKKAAKMEEAAGGFPGVSGAGGQPTKPEDTGPGYLGRQRWGIYGPMSPLKPGEVEMDAGDEL